MMDRSNVLSEELKVLNGEAGESERAIAENIVMLLEVK